MQMTAAKKSKARSKGPELITDRTIRIVHFNHNDKFNLNIGDQAHVLAIQESLSRSSKHKLVFIERSVQLLGRQVIPNKPYYPKSRYYPTFVQNLYRLLCGKSFRRLVAECNDADLILVGGGGLYMSYLFPLNNKLIDQFKTPLVIFGVGYNHNLGAASFNKRQLKSAAVLSRKATLQSVRDELTHAFLKKQGFDSTLMCDPAIFLSEIDSKIPKPDKQTLTIGVNMARHGWNDQRLLLDKLVDAYAELLKTVRQTSKVRIFYFVHQPNELLYVKLLENKGVKFDGVVNTKDARELKGAYRSLDITISMMLHSTILAFGANTPAICVGYDKKNLAFMKMTGQEDCYVSVHEVTGKKLINIFRRKVKNLKVETSTLKKRKKDLEESYLHFAREALRLIDI